MIGSEYNGMITSVSAGISKDIKTPEGESTGDICKFKLESANIEIPDFKKFYPEAIEMYESVAPCPADEIKFGKVFNNLRIFLASKEEQEEKLPGFEMEKDWTEYRKLKISKITMKFTENVPVFIFELEYPIGYGSLEYLFKNLKEHICFMFEERAKEESGD